METVGCPHNLKEVSSAKPLFDSPKMFTIEGFSGSVHPMLDQKLIPFDKLALLRNFYRATNRTVAFTTGAYDLVHIGHGRYLELARSLGDVLVVGLNSDESIKSYKGDGRPIQTEPFRREMLAFLSSVDYITIYGERYGDKVIRELKPDRYLMVEGSWDGDYEKAKEKPEVVAMSEHGGETYITPRQEPGVSTSDFVEKIMRSGSQEVLRALAKFLGQFGAELPH